MLLLPAILAILQLQRDKGTFKTPTWAAETTEREKPISLKTIYYVKLVA